MKGEKRDKESKSGHKHKKKKHSDRHDGKHHSKSKKHSKKENKKSLRDVDCTLTSDDYFVKSEEFRVWLKIDRDRYSAACSQYNDLIFIWLPTGPLRNWIHPIPTNYSRNFVRNGITENCLICITPVWLFS